MGPATIQADFGVEKFPSSLVPAGAFVSLTRMRSTSTWPITVNLYPLVPGDVLLATDSAIRLSVLASQYSLTNINPLVSSSRDDLLFAFNYSYPS